MRIAACGGAGRFFFGARRSRSFAPIRPNRLRPSFTQGPPIPEFHGGPRRRDWQAPLTRPSALKFPGMAVEEKRTTHPKLHQSGRAALAPRKRTRGASREWSRGGALCRKDRKTAKFEERRAPRFTIPPGGERRFVVAGAAEAALERAPPRKKRRGGPRKLGQRDWSQGPGHRGEDGGPAAWIE